MCWFWTDVLLIFVVLVFTALAIIGAWNVIDVLIDRLKQRRELRLQAEDRRHWR